MPKYYFFKNQPFNEKRTVQKWTQCPFLDTKTDITLDFFLYLYVWIK